MCCCALKFVVADSGIQRTGETRNQPWIATAALDPQWKKMVEHRQEEYEHKVAHNKDYMRLINKYGGHEVLRGENHLIEDLVVCRSHLSGFVF